MHITLAELKKNPDKYVDAANEEPVYISKDGKTVAKLSGIHDGKLAEIEQLFGILPPDTNLDKAKRERLNV